MASFLVVILTVALSTVFGSLPARELKKPVPRLPKTRRSNRAQRLKELLLSGRKKTKYEAADVGMVFYEACVGRRRSS